jgi:uncharacterized protein GlcG (DUF336 family)
MKSISLRVITHETAQDMVACALSYAQSKGWVVAVAVSDAQGGLVAFGRDDAVAPPIAGFALDKSYTAATLRKSTADFGARMASSPTLSLGISNRERFLTWGGGVPFFEDGQCIGAIGVSGAQDFEDIECAEAAIAYAGLLNVARV